MPRHAPFPARHPSVMVFGIGAFAQSAMRILRENGARVSAYLMRDYGHYGRRWKARIPCCGTIHTLSGAGGAAAGAGCADAIEWAPKPWAEAFLARGIPFLCPTHEALRIERTGICLEALSEARIPVPESHRAPHRQAALAGFGGGVGVCAQESAVFAVQPSAHDCLRIARGDCGVDPTGQRWRKGFFCRPTWAEPRRATSHWSAAARSTRWSPTRNTSAPTTGTRELLRARRWAGWWRGIRATNTDWPGN